MRKQVGNGSLKVWLSANDTYDWAHRPGQLWCGSFLSDRRLFAEFDNKGDLVALSIDGGRGDQNCPGHEFDCIIEDHVGKELDVLRCGPTLA